MAKWIATRYTTSGEVRRGKSFVTPARCFLQYLPVSVNVVVKLIRFALNQHDNQTQSRTEALPCGLRLRRIYVFCQSRMMTAINTRSSSSSFLIEWDSPSPVMTTSPAFATLSPSFSVTIPFPETM